MLVLAGNFYHTEKISVVNDIPCAVPSDKTEWSYQKLRIYLVKESVGVAYVSVVVAHNTVINAFKSEVAFASVAEVTAR